MASFGRVQCVDSWSVAESCAVVWTLLHGSSPFAYDLSGVVTHVAASTLSHGRVPCAYDCPAAGLCAAVCILLGERMSSVCGYAVVVLHSAVWIPFPWHLPSVCGLPPVANHHATWFACDHDRPSAWLLFQRMTLCNLLICVLSGKIVFFLGGIVSCSQFLNINYQYQ